MPSDPIYEPGDTDPWRLISGEAIDTLRVLALGNRSDSRPAFGTRARLVDRLGQERTYKLVIHADTRREAELRARVRGLGEVVTGEIQAIIPSREEPHDPS